jgi:hypothetical protein
MNTLRSFGLVIALWLGSLAPALSQSSPTVQVKLLSDLIALPIPTINNRFSALVTGRVSTNDGAGGIFFYDSSSTVTTNLGTVFKPSASAGRWLRQYDGELNAKWFGAVGDGVTDSTAALASALAVSESLSPKQAKLYIPSGVFKITDTLTTGTNASLTIYGDGRGSTFISHSDSTDTNGCLEVFGGVGVLSGGSFYQINNRPNITIHDIAFGSVGGPALYLHAANNVTVHDVLLFSASTDYPYLDINGGSQNFYHNIYTDRGNITLPSTISSLLVSSNGLFGIRITPRDTIPSVITEHSFVNVRSGGLYSSNAVHIVNTAGAFYSMFGLKFNNCSFKSGSPAAGIFLDSADVTIVDSDIEAFDNGGGAIADGILVKSTYSNSSLRASAVYGSNARLVINQNANAQLISIFNSGFYNLKVDAAPTTFLAYGNNFDVVPSGAGSIATSTAISCVGNVNLGPVVGMGSTGVGFTGPNAVFTIQGDAANFNAPVLSLSRLYMGQVSQWNLGVQSDKGLELWDANTTNRVIAVQTASPDGSLTITTNQVKSVNVLNFTNTGTHTIAGTINATNITTPTGALTLATGAANGNVNVRPNGSGVLHTKSAASTAGTYESIAYFSKTTSQEPLMVVQAKNGAVRLVGSYNGSAANVDFVFTPTTSGGVQNDVLTISASGQNVQNIGDYVITVAGKGVQIKEGSNARMGASAMTGGTVTVSNTSVTSNTRIFLTSNTDGGTPGWVRVSARSAGTSFTITSSSGTDTSTVAWLLIEPSP